MMLGGENVRTNLLMNCIWYEDVTPEYMANVLEITPERLFRKVFGVEEFTLGEIQRISSLLGLTEEDVDRIFFD